MFLDAYSVMYSQFHKDCYGGTGNITHVTTDELSNLLDAAAAASDAEKVAAYDAVSYTHLDVYKRQPRGQYHLGRRL